MVWVRKGIVHLLSLVLLGSLLGVAVSTSTNISLARPRVQQELEQSRLYDNFATYVTEQAQKTGGGLDSAGPAVKSYPAIKQAAEAAFPPQDLKKSISNLLNSNYDWLEGKAPQPRFTVDFTAAKQKFADQVGQHVKDRLASLPACTPDQLALLPDPASLDPLSIECRPTALNPDAVGTEITQKVATTDSFLENPVVTSETIGQADTGQPYYVKLAKAPKLYQLGQQLPFIFAVIALLTAIAIIFTALQRRRGWRRIGIVLLVAGILLILSKLLSAWLFKKLERQVFNGEAGPLQRSLSDFGQRVEHQMAFINLIFALIFLVLAAIILTYLYRRRQGTIGGRQSVAARPSPPLPKRRPAARNLSVQDTTGAPASPTGPPKLRPKNKKPPRLIQ